MSKKNIVRERLNYIALIIIVIGIVISILLLFKFHKWYFFIPTLYYYSSLRIDEGIRHTSEILGGISLAVTMIIFVKIFFIKTIKKQYILSFFGLGFSLLCYLLFFILAPGYTFKEYPEHFMYMDDRKEYIENVERYIYLVDSFGFYQSTYRPFKTLDDAIKGLEFAKEKKNGLYAYIFRDLEVFGYEEVFKKYDDVYFQLYFASEMIRDLGILNKYLFENYVEKLPILINYISDAEIKKLYEEIYTGYLKLEDKDPNYNEPMYEYKNVIRGIIEGLYNKKGF